MLYIAQRIRVVGEWVLQTSGLLGEQKQAEIFREPYAIGLSIWAGGLNLNVSNTCF